MLKQQMFRGLWLAGVVSLVAAQPARADVTPITAVRLNPTDNGLEVILETFNSRPLQVFTARYGETLVADVINAQLRLSEGNTFRQENPTAGIASVTVASLDANSVRITVTGSAGVPAAEVSQVSQGLVLSLTPAPATTAAEPSPSDPASPDLPEVEADPADPASDEDTTDETAVSEDTEDTTEESDPQAGEPIEDDRLGEIIVTATRTEEDPLDVPRSVTVITREEIEDQVALNRNVSDILGQLTPGFGPPNESNRSIAQNLRGRRATVLIDGVPVSTNLSTAFVTELRSIDPSAIERIEVLRGPTAIYGDGATGGVINIITRRPSEDTFTATTTLGLGPNLSLSDLGESFGGTVVQTFSGSGDNFDYFFSGSFAHVGGSFDAEGDRIPLVDVAAEDSDTLNFLGKFGIDIDADQRLQFTVNHFTDRQDSDYITDPAVDDLPFITKARALEVGDKDFIDADEPANLNTVFNVDYTHASLLGSEVKVQAFYRDNRGAGAPTDARGFFAPGIRRTIQDTERWGGRLQIDTPLNSEETLSVLWGLDYVQEDITQTFDFFDPVAFDTSGGRIYRRINSRTFVPEYNVENLGLFAQLQWDISDRWLVSGGLRYENIGVKVDDYVTVTDQAIQGGELNFDATVFNVGVVYRATDEVSLFANFAQGFSIPDFGRILRRPPRGFVAVESGLDLTEPQRVDSYELGVKGDWGTVQASLTGFYNESELGSTLRTLELGVLEVVRAPQRNYGLEATLDWQATDTLQFGGGISWTEAENDADEDGDYLPLDSFEVQPLKLTAYVEHQTTPGWRNRLQFLLVGDRDRAFDEGIDVVPIESYFTVDFISSIQVGNNGEFQIGIQNLFDEQYSTVQSQALSGFASSQNTAARGRTFGVSYRFTW